MMPEKCFSILKTTGELIVIKYGESGYYQTKERRIVTDEEVDYLNEVLGVTKEQKLAMEAGSMFGWNIPAADPAMWKK